MRWASLFLVLGAAACADYTLDGELVPGSPAPTSSPSPSPSDSPTGTPTPPNGILYTSDFEASDGAMSKIMVTGNENSWEWGMPDEGVNSATHAWATDLNGNYENNEYWCIEISVDLPAATPMHVRSWVRYSTEQGFDYARIRTCPAANGSCSTLFSDDGSSGGFQLHDDDLAAFAGTTRRLQWCIKSDGATLDTGLVVDDVAVGTTAALAALP